MPLFENTYVSLKMIRYMYELLNTHMVSSFCYFNQTIESLVNVFYVFMPHNCIFKVHCEKVVGDFFHDHPNLDNCKAWCEIVLVWWAYVLDDLCMNTVFSHVCRCYTTVLLLLGVVVVSWSIHACALVCWSRLLCLLTLCSAVWAVRVLFGPARPAFAVTLWPSSRWESCACMRMYGIHLLNMKMQVLQREISLVQVHVEIRTSPILLLNITCYISTARPV